MSLTWPSDALKAMASFFVRWNDIDVFVEDTAMHAESLYTALTNRTLEGRARVENVFGLGARSNVISACRNDSLRTGRPRIYLIDGDLDILAGNRHPSLPRLFQHHVYAIENYLISEGALIQILHEENPRYKAAEVKRRLAYANWLASLSACGLFDLFIIFAISKQLVPSLPTISLGLCAFVSGGRSPYLDRGRVDAFCVSRKAELIRQTDATTVASTESTVAHNLSTAPNPIDYFAGRDFVIPLLRFWIRSKGLALKADNESLQIRLAKVVPLDTHPEFKAAIQRTARDFFAGV